MPQYVPSGGASPKTPATPIACLQLGIPPAPSPLYPGAGMGYAPRPPPPLAAVSTPGDGTPVAWIKAHTSEAQRRTLGLTNEDVLGNERADVAANAALPAPSPGVAQGWRAHVEKFRLFWGTFCPTLARRDHQNREEEPRFTGQMVSPRSVQPSRTSRGGCTPSGISSSSRCRPRATPRLSPRFACQSSLLSSLFF